MARWLGNPQPDEFVRVSAELLVAIARTAMNDRERRLTLTILAATYGRYADHVHLTRSQLGKLADLTAPQVMKGLAELTERGIVIAGTAERGRPVRLQLDKRYGGWANGPTVDRSIEDTWRQIPKPTRQAAEPVDDGQMSLEQMSDQLSTGQLQVATGKVQVAHGKVGPPEFDAATPDPRALRGKRREPADGGVTDARLARILGDDPYRCGCDPQGFDDLANPHTVGSELWARHANEARRREAEQDQLDDLRSGRSRSDNRKLKTANRQARPSVTRGDGSSPPPAGSKARTANTSPTTKEATP